MTADSVPAQTLTAAELADLHIEILESGRYRVARGPDGTLVIARTLDSGERAPNVEIHAGVARIIGKILAGEQPDMSDLMEVLAGMPKGSLFPAFMGRMINGNGRSAGGAGGTDHQGEQDAKTRNRAARVRRSARAVGPVDQAQLREGSSGGAADPGGDGS